MKPPGVEHSFDVQLGWRAVLRPDEVKRIVRENIDKTVSIIYFDGTTQDLLVHTVDDEGFVCDLMSEMSEPPRYAYWVRFTDVREAHPSST
jgi:hypothetical protein